MFVCFYRIRVSNKRISKSTGIYTYAHIKLITDTAVNIKANVLSTILIIYTTEFIHVK